MGFFCTYLYIFFILFIQNEKGLYFTPTEHFTTYFCICFDMHYLTKDKQELNIFTDLHWHHFEQFVYFMIELLVGSLCLVGAEMFLWAFSQDAGIYMDT